MGIVITLVWASVYGIQNGFEIANRQAQFTSDVALPLQVMDKQVSQAQSLATPSGYTTYTTPRAYVVQVNQPASGTVQRYDVWIATSDHQLLDYQHRITGGVDTLVSTGKWSTKDPRFGTYNNGNYGYQDLFSYRDSSGNPTTTVSGANALVVNLVVQNWDSNRKAFQRRTGTRLIFLRNF